MQKFSGEGDTLGAYGASIFVPTALELNVTPLEKFLSYGLDWMMSVSTKNK